MAKFKGTKGEWITPYSTYLLSRYSTAPIEIKICECCEKKFGTNIGRKRCSSKCAKKARKSNKKLINKATE